MDSDTRVTLAELKQELKGVRELYCALRVEDRAALSLAERRLGEHLEKLNNNQRVMKDLEGTFYTNDQAASDEDKRLARRESHEMEIRSEIKLVEKDIEAVRLFHATDISALRETTDARLRVLERAVWIATGAGMVAGGTAALIVKAFNL